MLKRLSLAALVALLALTANAQVLDPTPFRLQAQDAGSCATANACVAVPLGAATSATIGVSGSFTGTLTFQVTPDNANWTTIQVTKLSDRTAVTTTTTTGLFALNNLGYLQVRVVATALTVGSAVITVTRGYASQ